MHWLLGGAPWLHFTGVARPPSPEPRRVPLVDGGLAAGFNDGIIFTRQTPLEET